MLNATLLSFPSLYGLSWINYESNLDRRGGIPFLLEQLELTLDVPGDIVECGSSRAGSACILARALERVRSPKKVLALDSFRGFDPSELEHERSMGLTSAPNTAFTSTSFDYVCRKLSALGLERRVVPIRGFFTDTLPELSGPFSLALVDCDLSESVDYCIERLWPLMAPGGRILVDDYDSEEFRGARHAVDAICRARLSGLESAKPHGRFFLLAKVGGR